MNDERARQQGWRESEVEAFRRLLAALAHPNSEQRPAGGEVDQTADVDATVQWPQVSLFEPDQLNPNSAVALPTPAGTPADLRVSDAPAEAAGMVAAGLALTLALGLSGVDSSSAPPGPPGRSQTRNYRQRL